MIFLSQFFVVLALGIGSVQAQVEKNSELDSVVREMKEDISAMRSSIIDINRALRENIIQIQQYQSELSSIKQDIMRLAEKIEDVELRLKSIPIKEYDKEITNLKEDISVMKRDISLIYIGVIFSLFFAIIAIFVGRQSRRKRKTTVLKI